MSSSRKTRSRKQLYAIGIGSNRPLSRRLPPRAIVAAALDALDGKHIRVKAVAPLLTSRPLGPSARDFANSAALVRTRLSPLELLHRLQKIERRFGRRRHRRWGARTLDLDILLWEGGIFCTPDLVIPHPALAKRPFVLTPLSAIAASWRDPASNLSIAQLRARHSRPKPVDRTRPSR